MRLLHTETLQLKEFFDDQILKYAILSHRWEGEEITMQDLQKGRKRESSGFKKVHDFCVLARADGYDWCWVDTCCIDRKSSADLSEAINSMYKWYDKSNVCYVYLSDVVLDTDRTLAESKWFTRGWTLQALIAPCVVQFFDQHWTFLGTKYTLVDAISTITGVKDFYLQVSHSLQYGGLSIAEKMSWASKRQTSRVEDMAYCLMGLFGINMPLLYGEGDKAFSRLQLEILQVSRDESIFAWERKKDDWLPLSVLAPSPRFFEGAGSIRQTDYFDRTPWLITNKGLQFGAVFAEEIKEDFRTRLVFADLKIPLNCTDGNGSNAPLMICVQHNPNNESWYRVCGKLAALADWNLTTDPSPQVIYLKIHP